MRYTRLQTIPEQKTGVLVGGNRSVIARLIRSTQNRADRQELINRLYWIGYPPKKITVTTLRACQDCADIVAQGYTDGIDDAQQHQDRCNHIDKVILPSGHYWLESVIATDTAWHERCECCGIVGPDRLVKHAVNL